MAPRPAGQDPSDTPGGAAVGSTNGPSSTGTGRRRATRVFERASGAGDLAGLEARGADVQALAVAAVDAGAHVWMFGFQRRWVRRCECETDMPKPGPFPQTSQTAAISDTPRGRRTRSAGRTRSRLSRVPGPSPYARTGRVVASAAALLRHRTRIRLGDVAPTLDAVLLEGWAAAAVAALERHRAEIDRINVFPVADRDTGTNLLLTMRAAAAGCGRVVDGTSACTGRRGRDRRGPRPRRAARRARQLRGDPLPGAARGGRGRGRPREGRVRGAGCWPTRSTAAPGWPPGPSPARSEGTVLTVLAAAADGPRRPRDRTGSTTVAVAAAGAAARRAARHPGPAARAGAGPGWSTPAGSASVVVLDALAALVTDRAPRRRSGRARRPPAARAGARDRAGGTRRPTGPAPRPARLRGHVPARRLRRRPGRRAPRRARPASATRSPWSATGRPDGGGTWNVHVHCTDIGAALEAGIAAGRPHGVRVVPAGRPRRPGRRFPRARAVLAVVCGPDVAALARAAGADVLERDCPARRATPDADVDEALLAEAAGRHRRAARRAA